MKKTVLFLLILCLCLTAGCGVKAFLGETDQPAPTPRTVGAAETPVPDASSSDAADDPLAFGHAESLEAAEREAEDSPSDAEAEAPEENADETAAPRETTGFENCTLEECVTDAEDTHGKLPFITLDCPGAEDINDDILGTFGYLVDADYCTLYYYASKDGDVLSLVIAQLYDGDASYYSPYLLDLFTGERMDGHALLERMGLSEEEVAAAELRAMGQEYEYHYGGMSDGDLAAFYEEQYARTTADENADTQRLWLDGGTLYFTARIYSLAGPEFIEYPMSTGYTR